MTVSPRAVVMCVFIAMCSAAAPPTTAPTVGVEGRIEISLPGSTLVAKPVTDKAKLLLRIASTSPAVTGKLYYDLRYIGLVPGDHELRDYLVRADGSSVADLPAIPVTVSHLLPIDHDGQLTPTAGTRWPSFGGYRTAVGLAIVAWALLIVPVVLARRRKEVSPAVAASSRQWTLADRLRPFIERAASGSLSIEDKATLERLMLGHWQRRLSLGDRSPGDSIAVLRDHPDAGRLLRSLEDWLHRPPQASRAQADVAALLEPYRDAPDAMLDDTPSLKLATAK